MRCVSSASSRARFSPAGGCSVATRGVTAASTTRMTRGCSRDPRGPLQPADADRAPAPRRPRLAAPVDRPPVGVVDRRADGARPDRAGAPDRPPDPLDAGDAGAHARDEGDPAEVQGRQEAPAGRADEVLPREQDQSRGVLPAAARSDPGFLCALLRPEELLEGPAVGLALLAAYRPEHRRPRERTLVRIPAARDLRGQPGLLDLLHVRDDGQDAALPDDGAAGLLHHLPAALPDGARHLLGDDQPVDGGAGAGHAALDQEDPAGAGRPPDVADASEDRARRRWRWQDRVRAVRSGARTIPAAEGQAE